MAKVRKIMKSVEPTKTNSKITEVDMEYSCSGDGQLFILRTFGSDDRKTEKKTSQVIHLDKQKANELLSILSNWVNL